ncbi:MAG: transglycosylase SLT domain-containing protein [Gammaproteobacteria bacterium]|nr:transglycosylase SLT domain-containing protein [Gammaproteobacteria bacterium]
MQVTIIRTAKRVFLAAVLVILIMPPALAVEQRMLLQRATFVDAEQALKAGRLSTYHKLEQLVRDYPLYPYLQFEEIKRNLRGSNYKDVQRFLEANAGTPLAGRLQYLWLKSLARQHQWATLIDNFYYTNDVALQCDFAHALIEEQQPQRAYNVLAGLWLTGHSLPSRCDYPIEKWFAAGGLTQELVWERIRLAMQARQSKLAMYLSKFVAPADRYWVRMWAKVHRDPAFVTQVYARFKDKDTPLLRWVIGDGLRRMSSKDAAAAASYWGEWRDKFNFSATEKDRIERRLTLALVSSDPGASKSWLKELELDADDQRINELYILNAIQDQDWEIALGWLDRMSEAEQQSDRWRYWRGRTLEALGRLDEARSVYLLNADSRSYYGFLSADRAGMDYRFDHRPLSFTSQDLSPIEKIPAIERARELYALNRVVDARREWNFALQQLDKSQMLKAAQLAYDWNWHDRAIITLAQANYWDDLEKRFPLAHRDVVINYAHQQQIDPAWAFAIIRQESAFTNDARSHAGALGLMQLLPRTARQIAHSLRLRFKRNDLLDAETNVRLGIKYLKKVKDIFNGNNVLATAAYNAGDARVRQWLPKAGMLPADVWVETVPYNETRDYLQRVMTYTVIYEERLGRTPVPLVERMLPITGEPTVVSSSKAQAGDAS